MKKLTTFVLVFTLLMSLTACAPRDRAPVSSTSEAAPQAASADELSSPADNTPAPAISQEPTTAEITLSTEPEPLADLATLHAHALGNLERQALMGAAIDQDGYFYENCAEYEGEFWSEEDLVDFVGYSDEIPDFLQVLDASGQPVTILLTNQTYQVRVLVQSESGSRNLDVVKVDLNYCWVTREKLRLIASIWYGMPVCVATYATDFEVVCHEPIPDNTILATVDTYTATVANHGQGTTFDVPVRNVFNRHEYVEIVSAEDTPFLSGQANRYEVTADLSFGLIHTRDGLATQPIPFTTEG